MCVFQVGDDINLINDLIKNIWDFGCVVCYALVQVLGNNDSLTTVTTVDALNQSSKLFSKVVYHTVLNLLL